MDPDQPEWLQKIQALVPDNLNHVIVYATKPAEGYTFELVVAGNSCLHIIAIMLVMALKDVGRQIEIEREKDEAERKATSGNPSQN